MKSKEGARFGMAGRLAEFFVASKLTPLALITSIALGVSAVLMLPREEEPQIKVPMIDVSVAMPGATAQEVENRVTRPIEKSIWEISGVEYIYSTSSPGQSLVIVRYKVGTELETALVRLNQKLQANLDHIPPGVGAPLVKPRTIDDVPVLAVTLHSRSHDQVTIRRLGAQLEEVIKALPDVAETTLTGGLRRAVRIQLDPAALAARSISPTAIAAALQQANRQLQIGSRPFANEELLLEVGGFFHNIEEVGALVVGVFADRPVYLRDLATIMDTAAEPENYVFFGSHRASSPDAGAVSPDEAETSQLETAVTLSVAKRPGANAVTVVENVLAAIEAVRGDLLPADVSVTTVRDYGHTAAEKSNELLLHMGIAVFGVAFLIQLFLGWRESIVVLLAIPSTLALTLLVFYLYGYTLNRITLFALIFSIGILVDDAIVVLENIIRHRRAAGSSTQQSITRIALTAVNEVGNPTILATWAVIAAILPMAFVGGLMGPYMRPIPIGASAAMLFSLAVAFTITPWAAVRVLRRHSTRAEQAADRTEARHGPPDPATSDAEHPSSDWLTRIYYRAMTPLLDRPPWRRAFLIAIVGLLGAAIAFVAFGAVKVKMLPFDNKSEFQIILNTPEGSTLEHTLRIAQEMAASISNEPEVRDYQIYAGTAAPFNFNGLVRHYFVRGGPNAADVQVNLVAKKDRSHQSHEIVRRLRPRLAAIAAKYGADVAVAEVPPGPPVLQTLVAEIYGPDEPTRFSLAKEIRKIFARTEGVVDVDWYVKSGQTRLHYVIDQEKAAHHGITTDTITRTLQIAAEGLTVGLLHLPAEREDVPLLLELAPSDKSSPEALTALHVGDDTDRSRPLVPLSELIHIEHTVAERDLYRKNLKPVTYVTGDVAGAVESPAYAMLKMNAEIKKIDATRYGGDAKTLPIYHLNLPFNDQVPSLKWDGEWHITLEVFRDLGLAFAAVLILIAMLMVGWFKSYLTPLVVMAAIPFSLIGILPAHWALGAFFTATSMIGFMAGAGIVVRNSIILVDFIELRRAQGQPLREAVIEAGSVRFRPMLLTALAVVVGASVILADPIFQGLAISLMFGEIASLLISRMAVPVLYYMANRHDVAAST